MNSSPPGSGRNSVFNQVISLFTSSNSTLEPEILSFNPCKKETSTEMANCESKSSESACLSKKAQMLHNAHKMSEEQSEWFRSSSDMDISSFAASDLQDRAPSYFKQKKFKPTEEEVTTSQLAYNINNNSYENLQVHQSIYNPYNPYTEDNFHPAELHYFQAEPELPQSSFLPFFNLYTNIMDFVETTIVHYVCQRSHPSPFRVAAEILARSRLNPNANEFTPTKKDVTVIDTESEKAEAHCSPPVCDTFDFSNSSNMGDTLELGNISVLNNSFKDIEGKKEEKIMKRTEGNHITLVEKGNDEICLKLVKCQENDNSICDIENYKARDSLSDKSDDDCMSDDYDDDDSDWDSEEQSTGQCVEIDASEFEDLFPSPLLLSNLSICQTKASSPKVKICTENPSPSSETELTLLNRDVSEINRKYFDQNEIRPTCKKSKTGCVKFCDDVKIIEEPEEIAEDLQNARISDFQARKADQERMERLLAPILTKLHRDKMFQKIYGNP